MLPDVLIIGAMKAGTTSLVRYLASSPDITTSTPKETDFFTTEENFAKGPEWYGSLFGGDASHAVEACPNYSKRHLASGVPRRIHSLLPDVRLVYLLRDPIERAISHWVFGYAQGGEDLPMHEALRARSNYVDTGRYMYQIEAYLEYFPRDRILLVESERMRTEPESVIREVCDFAGLPNTWDRGLLEKRFNVSGTKKRRCELERTLTRGFDTTRPLQRWVRGGIVLALMPFRQTFERPELTPELRDYLTEQLASDVAKLREWSGMRFEGWSL